MRSSINDSEKRYIASFELLRVIGMLMIFVHHTWAFLPFALPDFGGRGVELFWVLSGFVTHYSCSDKNSGWSFTSIFKFVKRKMARFYPLHLITLGCMMFLLRHELKIVPDMVLNALLLHSWVPAEEIYWGGNGVSWFISSLMFCYLCFPWIDRCIRKIKDAASIIFVMAGIFVLADLLYVLCSRWDVGQMGYLFYIFPPYTVIIFGLGCLAGRLYVLLGNSCQTKPYAAAVSLLLWIAVVFVCGNNWDKFFYILFDLGLVVLFAGCKERRVWYENRVLAYLSSISFEFYLIHHVVVRYYGVYKGMLFREKEIPYLLDEGMMFIASIVLSSVYHEAVRLISKRYKNWRFGR